MQERPTVPDWLVTAAAWTWRLSLLVVATLALLWLAGRLMLVTLPVVVAIIIATLCAPPADWLRARGWRDGPAAGAVVGGGFVLLAALIAVITPSLVEQAAELGPTLASAWESVLNWLETGPLQYDREQVDNILGSLRESLSEGGNGVLGNVITGVSVVAQVVTAFLLLIVLLFFFVKDGAEIVDWFLARTPARHRDTVRAVGQRAWSALGGYVRGTATIAFIDALAIMIGLIVLDVPLVAPLTLLVFLGGFLPVIGASLAGLVAVLVALADGGLVTALLTTAVIVAVQQVEGNFLQPVIMRRAVALHPVVILSALAAGAALFGVIGAFLAVPVAAVVAAVGNELRIRAEEGYPPGEPSPKGSTVT